MDQQLRQTCSSADKPPQQPEFAEPGAEAPSVDKPPQQLEFAQPGAEAPSVDQAILKLEPMEPGQEANIDEKSQPLHQLSRGLETSSEDYSIVSSRVIGSKVYNYHCLLCGSSDTHKPSKHAHRLHKHVLSEENYQEKHFVECVAPCAICKNKPYKGNMSLKKFLKINQTSHSLHASVDSMQAPQKRQRMTEAQHQSVPQFEDEQADAAEAERTQQVGQTKTVTDAFFNQEQEFITKLTSRIEEDKAQSTIAMEREVKQMEKAVEANKKMNQHLQSFNQHQQRQMQHREDLRVKLVQLETEFGNVESENQRLILELDTMVNKSKKTALYRDAASYKDRLIEMGFEFLSYRDLNSRTERTAALLDSIGFALNNNQLGVTMCAAIRLERNQDLQVYSVPAGQGKSRIIAGIFAALGSRGAKDSAKKPTHFHCVYNHQQLLDMDKPIIEKIAKTNFVHVRFSVPDSGRIQFAQDDEITIIDEFDYVMLDRVTKFSKEPGRKNKVIGLTATSEADLLQIEKNYLCTVLKFKFHNSMIKSSKANQVQPELKSFEDLMSDKSYEKMGKIVFCQESQVKQFKICVEAARVQVHVDIDDLNQLRRIQPGHLYLVTDQQLMRGFDYRCSDGLVVLIARKLDSKRALRQAFGRVGRYDDDVCGRFVSPDLKTIEPICDELSQKLVQKVNAAIHQPVIGQQTIVNFMKAKDAENKTDRNM